MKKTIQVILLIMLVGGMLATPAFADGAPSTILYQGRLTQANGSPITTATEITFKIYPTIDGVSALFTKDTSLTPDENGVFTVELGPLDISSHLQGTKRYLGITVGDDAEMSPRQVLTSVPYAISAENAKYIADNSVTTGKIADGAIVNADINNSAGITVDKISGTAVNLSSTQTITGGKTFDGYVYFGDSTLRVNNTGIEIGNTTAPNAGYLVHAQRQFNTANPRYGVYSNIRNANNGGLYGIYSAATGTTQGNGGSVYGFYGTVTSDGSSRVGVYGYAQCNNTSLSTGSSYGLYGYAYDGATSYGIFAYGGSATTNWAGYFSGNVHATGGYTSGKSSIVIDHPLDPENKYLAHSSVQSPDMMNVYNGNVITDGNGEAIVELPDYFEALNKDFRYQLTVIGDFSQAIIAEEISNNKFTIRTDKPEVKVSWQVTGIRADDYAKANPTVVEYDKPASEQGLYMHPEALGHGEEKYIKYEEIKRMEPQQAEEEIR
ncbi:MAG: hypothetical protein JW763_08915 [candidate division Zixibacteria bacterium]|nr:hypothetical protein [candidate division Zixibacteria bacterium]